MKKYAGGIFLAKAGSKLCLRPGPKAGAKRLRESAYMLNLSKIHVPQGSFHHFVVPLPLGGRLFVKLIITQIGRENKFSAEIFVPANSPLGTTEKMLASFLFFNQNRSCGRTFNTFDIKRRAVKKISSFLRFFKDKSFEQNYIF